MVDLALVSQVSLVAYYMFEIEKLTKLKTVIPGS